MIQPSLFRTQSNINMMGPVVATSNIFNQLTTMAFNSIDQSLHQILSIVSLTMSRKWKHLILEYTLNTY